jgi:predicted dehydrogenase
MSLRVGLIGSIGHIRYVLDGIPELEDVELVAAAKAIPEDDLTSVRKHEAFSDTTRFYEDWRKMLDEEKIDIVTVCRPYPMNTEASIAALERHIHVVSEKPVATSLESLAKLEEAVENSDARMTAMMGMRFSPAFQAAKKAVDDGLIGKPALATGQKSYKFGTRPEFFRQRETYGGSILWVAVHAIDYVRWAAGVEYTQVAALHGNLIKTEYPGCEDNGGILFKLSNGGTGMVNLDYLRPSTSPTHGDDRLRIIGSDGVVEVTGCGEKAVLIQEGEAPRDLPLMEAKNFFVDFVEELRGEGTHIIAPYEATYVARICLLARESADRNEILPIPAPPAHAISLR